MIKLGASYSCFEGSELLELSISQIRKHVDYIVLVYQEYSYSGKPVKEEDIEIILDLKKRGIVDEIVCYSAVKFAKNSTEARNYEREKRNIGRRKCLENNCTHLLDIDVDEFYKENEFYLAKRKIEKEGLEYTAVNYVNYYKHPIYQGINKVNQFVPFICKINSREIIGSGIGDFYLYDPTINKERSAGVDLTRGYGTRGWGYKTLIFPKEQIVMHHMAYVRKDLNYKFAVSSGTEIDKEQIVRNIKLISDNNLKIDARILYRTIEDIKIIDNLFKIPIWENDFKYPPANPDPTKI